MQNFTAYEFIGHTFSKTYSKVSSFKSCLFLTIVKCITLTKTLDSIQQPSPPWPCEVWTSWENGVLILPIRRLATSRQIFGWLGGMQQATERFMRFLFFFSHLGEVILQKDVFFALWFCWHSFLQMREVEHVQEEVTHIDGYELGDRSWSRSIMTDFLANDI